MTKLPKMLREWQKQTGGEVTLQERLFIDQVRGAAQSGVGYGWIQQMIEQIWQEWCEANDLPGGAWGPEWYMARIKVLEKEDTELKAELAKKRGKRHE